MGARLGLHLKNERKTKLMQLRVKGMQPLLSFLEIAFEQSFLKGLAGSGCSYIIFVSSKYQGIVGERERERDGKTCMSSQFREGTESCRIKQHLY